MSDIVEHQPISNVAPAAQHIEPNPHMEVTAANVDIVHEKEIEKELAQAAHDIGGSPTHTAALAQDFTGENVEIIEKPKVGPDDNMWNANKHAEIEMLKKGITPPSKHKPFLPKILGIFSRRQQPIAPVIQVPEGELKNAA